MGAQISTSSTVSNIINKSITDIIIKNSQNCSQSNSSSQKLNISQLKTKGCPVKISNISQNSTSSPNFECYASILNSTDFKNNFANAIKQNAESETKGVGGAIASVASSATSSNNITEIQNNLNIENLSKCIQNNSADQIANINNIEVDCSPCYGDFCKSNPSSEMCIFCKGGITIDNITQKVLQTAVGNCTIGNTSMQKTISDIANKVDQDASSKVSGIDPSIILISIVLGFLGFLYISGNTGTKLLTNPYFLLAIGGLVIGVFLYYYLSTDEEKKDA